MIKCPKCGKLKSSDVGIVSPPYEEAITRRKSGTNDLLKNKWFVNQDNQAGYGSSEGNIGNLPYKDVVGVVSPPYAGQLTDEGGNQEINQVKNRPHPYTKDKEDRTQIGNFTRNEWGKINDIVAVVSPPYQDVETSNQSSKKEIEERIKKGIKGAVITYDRKYMIGSGKYMSKYSQNPQNIGNLKDTNFVGITSPPYDNRLRHENREAHPLYEDMGGDNKLSYGKNKQNLGNQKGENYLSAMLQVYKEASKVCPIICTITKNPTRQKKLRRLDLDTAKLLELSGYKIIDYHRAVLFQTYEQQTLTGSTKKEYKGRLSFFKRLSLAKGNKASMWEDIIIGIRK